MAVSVASRKKDVVVGDLNISPFAIDQCEAGPDFEKIEFRTWLRSMLVQAGGHFFDVFGARNPNRLKVSPYDIDLMHLHAGHQILVLNNSTMGQEFIIFFVLGLAYTRSMM